MTKQYPESVYELSKSAAVFLGKHGVPLAGKAALWGSILFAGYATLPHGSTYSEEHNDKVAGCARVYASPTRVQTPWKADVSDEDCKTFFENYEEKRPLRGGGTITEYRLPLASELVNENRWGEAEDNDHTAELFTNSFWLLAGGQAIEVGAVLRRRMQFDDALQRLLAEDRQ
jgi:hypothetical protein